MRNTQYCIVLISFILFAFTTDSNRSNYNIPAGAETVVLSDIDNDGDQDIIVGHARSYIYNWGGISVSYNNDNFYEDYDSLLVEYGMSDVFSAKLNNNIYEDLFGCYIITDPYTVYTEIIYDHSIYGFDSIVNYELSCSEKIDYFSSGDLNGDNNQDIVFASNNESFWAIMYNDGTGAFEDPIYYTVENSVPSGIECGDIDGNGRDDVVLCGQTIEVFLSHETGFENIILQTNSYKSDASIVDFDDDGDNDVLTFAGLPVSITQMYENTRDNFDTIPEHYFYALSKEFFVTDFNNDNLPDIIYLLSSEPGCVIWYNEGNFQLADSTFIPVEEYESSHLQDVCCADMDGNGFNDIVIIRLSQIQIPSNLTILYNDGNGHFVNDPVGINENSGIAASEPEMSCYPNPFSEELNITINHDSNSVGMVQIFDLQGRVIYEDKINTSSNCIQKLHWNGFDSSGNECGAGVYILQFVVDGNIVGCEKVVKY